MESRFEIAMRVVLGVMMVVFGANRLVPFIPEPPWPEGAREFLHVLGQSRYVLPVIGATDVATGVMLLSNAFVPLALVIMFPILLNATLFHLFLAPGTMLFAVLSVVLNLALLYRNRECYQQLLLLKRQPT